MRPPYACNLASTAALLIIPCAITRDVRYGSFNDEPDRLPHAGDFLRTRQPDEYARAQPLHRGVAAARRAGRQTESDSRDLRALVHLRHGGNRHGAAKDHPRFLRLSADAVRRAI